MGFRMPGIVRQGSFSASKATRKGLEVPKGYLAVYVGVNMRRFVIPISYVNQSSFQDLLSKAEQEFGYDHPTGGLTIPCDEEMCIRDRTGTFLEGIVRQGSVSASKAARKGLEVPKGYLAVYVRVNMRRFVIPISYVNQSSFQDLLSKAEQEFGYDHPTGGLTIPCDEDEFLSLTSRLNELL
ncbi:SAUR family protein [Vigna unguiculata]|uniref:SAUR family protein n=1 Tax=Vigna unguiculata TaxID=3917 RepID=A0A4D6MUL2_VIGUN|nr:SAUR family protein [Vigna unguiculata]